MARIVEGSHSFTMQTILAFAFPASLTDLGGMEGRVGLVMSKYMLQH